MNCADLIKGIGLSCAPLPIQGAASIYCIVTPFQYCDGDGICIFAEELENHLRFFDDGNTLFHVLGSGIKITSKRNLSPIKSLVEQAGAIFSEEGEIEILVRKSDIQDGFRKIIKSILDVSSWEESNMGIPESAVSLSNEVEIYLREWKPHSPIFKNESLRGISGKKISFGFLQDNTFIDVVSSAPQSTAAEIRKLADVRGVPSQSETPVLVVLDDRDSKERAKEEAAILSQFAAVMMLSALQEKTRRSTLAS